MIVGLVIAGVVANSVSVLAAAGDTVADCFGRIVGLIAIRLRDQDPDHPNAQRPIAIAALVNATLLLVVVATIVFEAVSRVIEGSPPVEGVPLVIVAVITMFVMLTGAVVLGRSAASEDLHMRSVLLDSLADAAAAAAIAVAGIVILLTGGLYWLDPVLPRGRGCGGVRRDPVAGEGDRCSSRKGRRLRRRLMQCQRQGMAE